MLTTNKPNIYGTCRLHINLYFCNDGYNRVVPDLEAPAGGAREGPGPGRAAAGGGGPEITHTGEPLCGVTEL